jgi:hypothetical protein
MTTPLNSAMTTQTIFVVASAATSSYMDILGVAGTSIDNGIQVIMSNNYTQFVTRFGGTSIMTGGTVTQNTPFLYGVTYISGGNSFIYLNGSQTGSNASSPAISGTGTVMLGAYRINSITDEFYNGRMNEVLVYNQVLSTSQRQRIEGYLAEKWGLRGSLGGLNHPSRFGPPMILPTQISGCTLWLDAADATTFTLSGSNVTQWRDKSGNGRNFTRAGTADRLTRITVDGNPVVYFNSDGGSSNAWMTGTVPFSSSVTVLKVFTPIVFSPYNNIFWAWAWTAEQDRAPGVRGWNGTPDIQPYVTWVGHNNNRIALTYGTPYVSFVEFTGGGANTRYSINGSTSVSSGTIASNTITPSTFFLGGDGPPSGATIQGRFYLSEFIVFSNTLTDTQRQQVEGYLAWKWGLQANLPTSTHPYKAIKP